MTDETADAQAPWGAYLLFVRWGTGAPQVTGHLETGFLVTGQTESVVRHQLGAMPLASVKATLDGLIRTGTPDTGRRWWEVAAAARDEDDDLPRHDARDG